MSAQHSYSFDGVVFDLDGVITKTAALHNSAWKKVFDDYLQERAQRLGEKFKEFDPKRDYLEYVDGKLRYEGARSFFESRQIKLPMGEPTDGPEQETVCGVANRKNKAFLDILVERGVEAFPSSVRLMRDLLAKGLKVGVASASKNCAELIRSIKVEDLVEVRVDGVVSAELGLKSKPHSDIFVTAAQRLGIKVARTVVVEDATSGVAAGRHGNFGLVIGIARHGNRQELLANGADIVVEDLEEIDIAKIDEWFRRGLAADAWQIKYFDIDPRKERSRESLLAVGNGYVCTRGALEESGFGGISAPGTYMAGLYNRLISKVAGRDVSNEDLVNSIQWQQISFKFEGGEWFDPHQAKLLSVARTLDMKSGVLERTLLVEDGAGRQTELCSRRLISMADKHLAAAQYRIKPLNYAGEITVRSVLAGDHINSGVARYAELNQQHLEPLGSSAQDEYSSLVVQTTQSRTQVLNAARLLVHRAEATIKPEYRHQESPGRVTTEFSVRLAAGQTLQVEKLVAIHSSHDCDWEGQTERAPQRLRTLKGFAAVERDSVAAWDKLWQQVEVKVQGDRLAQKLLHLHSYHLMLTCSPLNADSSWSLPARGWHGEAYRGHLFWDELFVLPLYSMQQPEVARAALHYRVDRLAAARAYAREHGYQGAMFAWQSGSDGREETQTMHLNPVSGEWGPDHSTMQRHVSLAVAYNIWQYYHISGDQAFMAEHGWELIFEVCRFWAGKCEKDAATGRYSISRVMGPNEFHEKKPGAAAGLKDNAYTNVMSAWLFNKAAAAYAAFSVKEQEEFSRRIALSPKEPKQWADLAGHLNLVLGADGLIAQHDGFLELAEVDWEHYRSKYGNIYRMDRLLKAEGKSADDYQVSKQADLLMLFYNLEVAEVTEQIKAMGYQLPADYVRNNYDYYLKRTSHGSTLSRMVHAVVAAKKGEHSRAWDLYREALVSDFDDVQGGTTAEGIHTGVMGGTLWGALTTFGGLHLSGEVVEFQAGALAPGWEELAFKFLFHGETYECVITPRELRLQVTNSKRGKVPVQVAGQRRELTVGEWTSWAFLE